MEASQIAVDIASAIFFSLGSVAIVIGVPLAMRRLFFEQPYAQSWHHEVLDCHLRRVQRSSMPDTFVYTVSIRITNRSNSAQYVARTWAMTVLPSDAEDLNELLAGAGSLATSSDAEVLFQTPGNSLDTQFSPGDSFGFGQQVVGPKIEHVVGVTYCFEARPRRSVWPGYAEGSVMHSGSLLVPVDLDDIKHYGT